RAAGNFGGSDPALRDRVVALASDPAPEVQLQVAIAARKLEGIDPVPLLTRVLAACGDDKIIPNIVWQNLHPLLDVKCDQFLQLVEKADMSASHNLAVILPRVIDRILGGKKVEPGVNVALLALLAEGKSANAKAAQQCLALLAGKIQTGELAGETLT